MRLRTIYTPERFMKCEIIYGFGCGFDPTGIIYGARFPKCKMSRQSEKGVRLVFFNRLVKELELYSHLILNELPRISIVGKPSE